MEEQAYVDASVPTEGRGSHVWPPKEALAGDIYSAQDRVFCSCSSATTQTSSLSQTAVSSIMSSYSVKVTDTPAIKNAPLIGLAEGNGYFSNAQLAALVLGVPWLVKRTLPVLCYGGFKTYVFLVLLLGIPITAAYWTVMSTYGPRINQKVQLPGRNIEEYIFIKDPELKAKYFGKEKIPMQVFHDAFFDDKVDFNGSPSSASPTLVQTHTQPLLSRRCS